MESESSEERTSWTLDSKGIVRFEADEIYKAYENFKKAKVPSEKIACVKIGQELLLQQLVDIFYCMKKLGYVDSVTTRDNFSTRRLTIEASRNHRQSFLARIAFERYASMDDESNLWVSKEHDFIVDLCLDHLQTPESLSICIKDAEEAYHLLVISMFKSPSCGNEDDKECISEFNTYIANVFYIWTKEALQSLMQVTSKAEPEPLALIDDHFRKIKLKSEHSNDLWILSTSRSCGGSVDVQVTVKPVVLRSAADGSSCVTMKFRGLWVKPSDLELVTELNLTFAPLTIDPKCVVLVETELGSPNHSYDISVTEGATQSKTLNISTGPGPVGNTTSGTSTATTIKGTTKDWTHSQLKSPDRFYAFRRTFVTDQVAPESNCYSGTYCWKLESVAGKKLQEYLKPKRGWNFRPWIPKPNRHGKRIPRLSASGVSWNMDGSVNLTCEDYPKSIKWHLKDQDMNETMKWMVKLEIIVTDNDGATRRFILWSDSLEIPPSTINEEGSSSTMSKDEV